MTNTIYKVTGGYNNSCNKEFDCWNNAIKGIKDTIKETFSYNEDTDKYSYSIDYDKIVVTYSSMWYFKGQPYTAKLTFTIKEEERVF